MAESREAWDRVGQDFGALGRQVKQHFEEQTKRERADEPRGDAPGDGAQGPPPADRRKVDEALRQLSDSLEQAFSTLGEAIRDPRFGEQTRKAAGSLSDALAATFAEATERFKRR
jgi:hypothetical protein